jgi:hypothetical protein
MPRLTCVILLCIAGLLAAAPVAAQGWDTPMFLPPYVGEEIGGYPTFPSSGDWGLQGIWRQQGSLNLGLRGGVARTGGGAPTVLLVGVEAWGGLGRRSDKTLDLNWVTGLGATFRGHYSNLRIPLGISIGKRLQVPGLALTPYILPRLAYQLEGLQSRTHSTLNFEMDLGLDLTLASSVTFRAVGTVGAWDTFGLGVAFPVGRSVAAH